MMGAMAADYEKLGAFYLGKEYDLAAGTRRPGLVLYDSKDLVTHAVCVGMTGSGKTGLGIGLIEEAAIDGVPVLAIDPKGDLANLLLTFPDLAPADFAPWVDPADATRHNLAPDAFAAQQAEMWKKGLAEWDEDGARIGRLKAAADFRVYTPGSRAGVPLALLNSLSASANEGEDDARTRITTTASSLLALAGLTDAAPHSREQALIAAILAAAPSGSRGSSDPPQGTASTRADLPWLVGAIQKPPFAKVGVLDLETFYPAKDRQDLALRFNSVLATPGFDVWLDGDPLDIGSMLYTPQGKPRVAIVSIAHLGDAERMLVVSLLLSALLDWTRKQGGTSSLRAMLYMDEVFGYLPPVANPPSKAPLLTLLKQARAFGVGIVLATQNPVDLDYKGLSNTGTWFLGKLQTERDKARVLDGLEGVTAGLDRKELDATLSGLKSRVFLMHNVHESGPVVFETRWTLSYLRGPMGREELKRVSGGGASAAKPSAATTNGGGPRTEDQGRTKDAFPKPVLPANVPEYFINANATRWRGVLYGSARVHYTDTRLKIDTTQDLNVIAHFAEGAVPVDWDSAEPANQRPEDLVGTLPNPNSSFEPLPPAALDARKYAAWTKDFGQWVMRAERLTLYSAPSVKLTSTAGESELDFKLRISQGARESRDAAVEKLRAGYAPKVARLTQRIQTAEQGVAREQDQASQQRTQTMVSFGATVIGALLGRKAISASTLGRATTAVRGVGRSVKETQDVARASDKLSEAQEELKALEAEINEEIAALTAVDAGGVAVETIEVKPKRGGVDVRLVALAWKPIDRDS